MITFAAGDQTGTGYLALPQGDQGSGVLVLHAWWGLTPFFKGLCDRLAREGFVALAPDLYRGKTAATIDEAKALLKQRDVELMQATATGALAYLRGHPAARGGRVGALGFSMGAAWTLVLASLRPEDVAAAVIFYGTDSADFTAARAAYLGHFAEDDEWEPLDGVRQMEADLRAAGREVTFQIYPGARHWFFESDRPEYDPDAAELAWRRTLAFLREQIEQLPPPQDKAELLERIHSAYAALEQAIGQLSEEQMVAPIHGSWSAKDLLAHITAWEQIMLHFHVGGQPFNDVVGLDTVTYAKTPIDEINEALHRRDKDKPLPDVLNEFRRSHQQLLATLEGMAEADLFKPYTPPGRGPDSAGRLIDWIVGDSYEHYQEHLATIRAL